MALLAKTKPNVVTDNIPAPAAEQQEHQPPLMILTLYNGAIDISTALTLRNRFCLMQGRFRAREWSADTNGLN